MGHSTGLGSLCTRTKTKGKSGVGKLPRSICCGRLEYVYDVDGEDGAARAPYVLSHLYK